MKLLLFWACFGLTVAAVLGGGYEFCRCCPCPCTCECEITPPECLKKLDFCLIIDGSNSISRDDYEAQKTFYDNFMSKFVIGHDHSLTYMIDVESPGTIEWAWDNDPNSNNEEFSKALEPLMGGFMLTALSDGLNLCCNTSFATDRPNVNNVAIVVTDGLNNSPRDLQTAAEALKAKATVFVVGVGQGKDPAKLGLISSDGTYFDVADYSDLADQIVADNLFSEFCTPAEKICECCCPEPKYPFFW